MVMVFVQERLQASAALVVGLERSFSHKASCVSGPRAQVAAVKGAVFAQKIAVVPVVVKVVFRRRQILK
jgi:hypothetical protein